ncbi:MAG: hypothetical protein KDC28_17935 [Saprospiraceae bacterium]|nr:hypothetical protein [Saprospiraceae bacterium]MCB9320155.1 hypothetical protein [Lewinellaceae bacterium]
MVTSDKDMMVYTRLTPSSSIKELRIDFEMTGTVAGVMEVLDDVEGYSHWVYKCEEPERITTISGQEFYYYVQTDMPFPASDRDLIIRSRHQIDPATGIYRAHSLAAPAYLPDREGMVRVRNFESYWTVKPAGTGRVSIDYRVRTDPGGSIPAWIINLGISVGPVKTMDQLAAAVHAYSSRVANREDD